ncbi:MAG: hypothetical protein ACRYG7_08820 [Janthinobacterium lividum]
MSYTFDKRTTAPAAVQALLAANRLEARPRSPEFNRALRAEVRDATWLLARQWQMREFRAEDRGTPAYAEVTTRQLALNQLTGPGANARTYNPSTQPLEAAVEAQPRPIGAGLRLQMGQYWLRQLRATPALTQAAPTERAKALQTFGLALPLDLPDAATEPVAYAQLASLSEVQAALALAGTTPLDGYALYQALLVPMSSILKASGAYADNAQLMLALDKQPLAQWLLDSSSFKGTATPDLLTESRQQLLDLVSLTDLDQLARQYVLAMHRLYLLGADNASWSAADLGYSFTVGTTGSTSDGMAAVGLSNKHYSGGGALPWYALDQVAAPASNTAPAPPELRRLLPTEVQFAGAPAARWWEFEDRRVDFGQVTGHPADWGRMLLQEFMFLYQNDWFSIPYTLDTGSITAVEAVHVTDVFGLTYALEAAGAGTRREPGSTTLIDNDAGRWRLFAQADAVNPAATPQLYLPPTALGPLVSQPVEQVSFRREEATNLVWAVESIISDGFAGGLDGTAAATHTTESLRRLAPASTAIASSDPAPAYTYALRSTVPENWVPFLPVTTAEGGTTLWQGALPRQVPRLTLPAVQPRTVLLQGDLTQPYLLHEHEVPPAGVRVEGRSYRARWHNGRTISWFGRLRGPVQVTGSSGLAFDQLLPGQSA